MRVTQWRAAAHCRRITPRTAASHSRACCTACTLRARRETDAHWELGFVGPFDLQLSLGETPRQNGGNFRSKAGHTVRFTVESVLNNPQSWP